MRNATITIMLFLFSLSACRKVIGIDVRDADIKYVVEGIVTNEPGSCRVLLSQSKPFYENNQFAAISGATITITENGLPFSLLETSPGVYENNSLRGTAGHAYQLTVSIGGQVFTAGCTMPGLVNLDTLYVAAGPFGQFQFAHIGYEDPAAAENFYRMAQYLNGVKDPAIFWARDEFTNGQKNLVRLDTGVDRKDDPRAIKSGDEVTIELQSVSEDVYRYWYSLRSGGGAGSGSIAAPANPVTNIEGGALGYFSAHAVDRRTVVAP